MWICDRKNNGTAMRMGMKTAVCPLAVQVEGQVAEAGE
jgi:hypothetical protein